MRTGLCCLLVLWLGVQGSLCWDQEELDLFDLVEEIEENFYDILGVEQTASPSEIKRAYRQLSLKLHPDKSDDPDAAEKFRKLVAVAEVLKDEQKREWYDQILVDGLPDWKQPLFYYRRVRKMGLLELSILVLLMATVAHYLFGWAVYVEKQLVLQELMTRKQKRERKTKKSTKTFSHQLEAELEYHTAQANASIPSLRNLLPVVLAKASLSLARYFWSLYTHWRETHSQKSKESERPKQEETEEEESENEAVEKSVPRRRSGRKRVQGDHTERNVEGHTDGKDKGQMEGGVADHSDVKGHAEVKVEGQDETSNSGVASNEIYDSGGYEDQLEAIMNDLDNDDYSGRTKKSHVTKTVAKPRVTMETNKLSIKQDSENNVTKSPPPRDGSHNTKKGNGTATLGSKEDNPVRSSTQSRTPLAEVVPSSNDSWTQYQQTQLEWALTQYPKFSKDRWENIAKAVPGKSTDECVNRCKVLFEAVRRRKEDCT